MPQPHAQIGDSEHDGHGQPTQVYWIDSLVPSSDESGAMGAIVTADFEAAQEHNGS